MEFLATQNWIAIRIKFSLIQLRKYGQVYSDSAVAGASQRLIIASLRMKWWAEFRYQIDKLSQILCMENTASGLSSGSPKKDFLLASWIFLCLVDCIGSEHARVSEQLCRLTWWVTSRRSYSSCLELHRTNVTNWIVTLYNCQAKDFSSNSNIGNRE